MYHFIRHTSLWTLDMSWRSWNRTGDRLVPPSAAGPTPACASAHASQAGSRATHAQFPHARHDTLTRAYACAPLQYGYGATAVRVCQPSAHIQPRSPQRGSPRSTAVQYPGHLLAVCDEPRATFSLSALSSARWPLRPHTSPLPPSTRASHSMPPRRTAVRAKPPRRRRERPSQHPT